MTAGRSADEEIEVLEEVRSGDAEDAAGESGEGRRRRRRGGRGRGRGRGRDADGAPVEVAAVDAVDAVTPSDDDRPARPAVRLPYEDEEPLPGPAQPRQRPTPFGSFWDSQIGVPASPPPAAAQFTALPDEDEEDEPEIPEYLLAERRRGRAVRPVRAVSVAARWAVGVLPMRPRSIASDSVGVVGRAVDTRSRRAARRCRRARAAASDSVRISRLAAAAPDRDRYQGGRDHVPAGAPPAIRTTRPGLG